jgi:hypothetical protein
MSAADAAAFAAVSYIEAGEWDRHLNQLRDALYARSRVRLAEKERGKMAGFDVPTAMAALYGRLEDLGFSNDTPPTPDEWSHPAGMQVRLAHVAGNCEIKYRRTPSARPEIKGVDQQIAYDRSHPWNEMRRAHGDDPSQFMTWLLVSADVIRVHLETIAAVAP